MQRCTATQTCSNSMFWLVSCSAGKAGSSTRQKILRWLLDLLPRLEPGQLVQYVPAVLKAARYHAVNEETANPRQVDCFLSLWKQSLAIFVAQPATVLGYTCNLRT